MSSYQDDVVLSELQLYSAVAVHQQTRFHFYNTQVESVFTSNIDSEMINSSNTNNAPLLTTNSCVDTETAIDVNDVDVHRRPRIRYQAKRTPAKAEVITSNSDSTLLVTDLESDKTISHPLLFDSAECLIKHVNNTSLLIHHMGATPLHSVGLQVSQFVECHRMLCWLYENYYACLYKGQ